MAAHTVTIKKIERWQAETPIASPLGVEYMAKMGDPIIRTTIDVDDTVIDHWHYFAPEALVTRMEMYSLDTEADAVEALTREVVRMWDPVEHPADAEQRVSLGGADVGIEVIWAASVRKDALGDLLAPFAERMQRFREMQSVAPTPSVIVEPADAS